MHSVAAPIWGRVSRTVACACTALLCSVSQAQLLTGPVLRVQAVQANGSNAEFSIFLGDAGLNIGDRSITWSRSAALQLMDENGQPIATLRNASVYMRQYPPRITVNYSVQAGNDTTYFNISTGLIHFPPVRLDESIGRANASITLTDMNLDGAEVQASGAFSGIFSSYYDGKMPENAPDRSEEHTS